MGEPLSVLDDVGQIRTTQTRFIWSLNNFENIIGTCSKVSSSTFSTMTDGLETKWKLHLHLKETDEKDDIGIFIECLNRNNICATVEFYVLDVNDKMAFTYAMPREQFYSNITSGTPTFMELNDILSRQADFYSAEKPLRIVCVVITNESIKIEEEKEEVRRKDWQRLHEFNKFTELWWDKEFCDVVLNVKEEKIPAHKNILACSSAVFKAMLVDEALGINPTHQIIIDDVDPETMRYLLEYIYTGEIRTVNEECSAEIYLRLLAAADKYLLCSLRSRCEEKLAEKLTTDNVFRYLRIAELCSAFVLKQECVEFVLSNAETIVDTTIFEAFVESEPKLSCELFRTLISKSRKM